MPIWTWLRGKGGNPEEDADLAEERGDTDPGDDEADYLADSAYGEGFAAGDAAGAVKDDLDQFKPPKY
jgi:hypothetical protein